jgi:hypothetical protein
MKRLVIVRKVFKILYPDLTVIVRYNKQQYVEIILKNVKQMSVDNITYKVILLIPGKDSLVLEDFVSKLFAYCSIINEDNCVIKYLDKRGSRQVTKKLE